MSKRWSEVIASPEYQNLSSSDKAAAQAQYFDQVVKPKVSAEDVDKAHDQFYQQYPVGTSNAPQPAPEESLGDKALDVAKGMGRIAGGAVADVANIGVGAVNAVKSAGAWAGKELGLGDGTYTPMQEANYGETLNPYLMPATEGEKIVASIPSYMVGGEAVAPVKAAEDAGRVARTATSLLNQLPAATTGSIAQDNQNPDNLAADIAVNTVLPAAVEKVGGAVVRGARNVLPESLGGYSTAEKAATVANPEYLDEVLQEGNKDYQDIYRTATTDDAGNSILIPQQVFNTEQGAKYIRAGQRDLNRGDNSMYQQRINQQLTGDSFNEAAKNIPQSQGVQEAAQVMSAEHTKNVNKLYENAKNNAQSILDQAPVKITELKFPDTKDLAQTHLDKNTANSNSLLTTDARKTLNAFNNSKITNINDLDGWKRTLSEKASKAFKAGDMDSYRALSSVKNNLRTEADDVISSIDPNAGSIYDDADRYFAQTVEGYGKRSELQRIINAENDNLASNRLFQRGVGDERTYKMMNNHRAAPGLSLDPEIQARNNLASAIVAQGRNRALDASMTGENFSPTKFINQLNRDAPTALIAGTYAPAEDLYNTGILKDVASRMKASNYANVGEGVNPIVSQGAARLVGGTVGTALGGGIVGAGIGQHLGGQVADALSKGLIDRLGGRFSKIARANEYIQFLSDPANAQQVANILADRGGLNAPVKDVISAIHSLSPTANAAYQGLQVSEPSKPVYQEPQSYEQPLPADKVGSGDTSSTFDAKTTNLYRSLAHAETGNLPNRFIRTKAAESGVSTAYGPAQLTVSTMQDFAKRHGNMFTAKEKEYVRAFIKQGRMMKNADPSDPVYGYGAPGTLGDKDNRRMYANVVRKMLQQMIKDNGGSLEKTMYKWRGNDNDTSYFQKVRAYYHSL